MMEINSKFAISQEVFVRYDNTMGISKISAIRIRATILDQQQSVYEYEMSYEIENHGQFPERANGQFPERDILSINSTVTEIINFLKGEKKKKEK